MDKDQNSFGSRFLVDRRDLHRCSWDAASVAPSALPNSHVLIGVEHCAFTANNITYAKYGDAINYWRFFPAPDPWGLIPVWGVGRVLATRHPDISEGETIYGYFPLGDHVVLRADNVTATRFVDSADHRASLPKTYNEYTRLDQDSAYVPANRDAHLVLRPLFSLSFFLSEFLKDRDFFGAESILVTSASSKTAVILAYLLRSASPERRIVGLTSARHVGFVHRSGKYHETASYEDVETLPDRPSILIDTAGDSRVRDAVHEHWRDNLRYSSHVGATHWDAPESTPSYGPKPEFFFTPDHILERRRNWGAAKLRAKLQQAWDSVCLDVPSWLRIDHVGDRANMDLAYSYVLEGTLSPDRALIFDLLAAESSTATL